MLEPWQLQPSRVTGIRYVPVRPSLALAGVSLEVSEAISPLGYRRFALISRFQWAHETVPGAAAWPARYASNPKQRSMARLKR